MTGCLKRFFSVALLCAACATGQPFDVVIANGRVMDPESGLDAVRHLGIAEGTIRAVSAVPLVGKRVIDAAGLVVSPGFIDLHWHGRDIDSYRYAAMQGVTAALELEVGVADVKAWYSAREGKSRIHFGASAGHPPARMAVMKDPGTFLPSGDAANRAAAEEEITAMKLRIERGLKDGAPAAGFGIAYTQAATVKEIIEMFRVAARFGAPCHVHLRSLAGLGPEAGLTEVIAAAAVTGAPLHVVHINSSSGASIEHMLRMIFDARARGMDITTEAYPYTAGASRIESALFSGWENRPDSYFQQLQWPPTGERLTRESFQRYRAQGGRVITHGNTEERVKVAVMSPLTMIASDGGDLPDGRGHPRSSGTFAKILGKYVREEKALTLMEALSKMTIQPARRLENRVPAMRNRGRIRFGAAADITVFDAGAIIDKSTYESPAEYAEGVKFVLVDGIPVVDNGKLLKDSTPGRAVRAPVVD